MANITALTVARNHQASVRKEGLLNVGSQMTLYCSAETHSCIQKAVEILGLGTEAVRKISVNAQYEINTYTVTFKDWDGTVLKTQEVQYGGRRRTRGR